MNVFASQVTYLSWFTSQTYALIGAFDTISRAFSTDISLEVWIVRTNLHTLTFFKSVSLRAYFNAFLFLNVKNLIWILIALYAFSGWILSSARFKWAFSCSIDIVPISASSTSRSIVIAWNTVFKSWWTKLALIKCVNKAQVITVTFLLSVNVLNTIVLILKISLSENLHNSLLLNTCAFN